MLIVYVYCGWPHPPLAGVTLAANRVGVLDRKNVVVPVSLLWLSSPDW